MSSEHHKTEPRPLVAGLFGFEIPIAYQDSGAPDVYDSDDPVRGLFVSNGQSVAFLYLPASDSPAIIIERHFLGFDVAYGWKTITLAGGGLSVLSSAELADLVSCQACDWPGARTSTLSVSSDVDPGANLRIAQFLAHDLADRPEVVREYSSQMFEDWSGHLSLEQPEQTDLGQIPLSSPGEVGAMFLLALYEDSDADGLHTTEPILAVSRTAVVYGVQPDELGYRWYSVTYEEIGSPPEGPFPLDVENNLQEITTIDSVELTGTIADGLVANRVATESRFELYHSTPIASRPVDAILEDPPSIIISGTLASERMMAEDSGFNTSHGVEYPILYFDQNDDHTYDFPSERVAYLCEGERVIGALYIAHSADVELTLDMVIHNLAFGWNVLSFVDTAWNAGINRDSFVFSDTECEALSLD